MRKSDIKGLLEFLRVAYDWASENTEIVLPCPFCGKDRHLYFNPAEGVFMCQRCGEAGRAERLHQQILKFVVEGALNEKGTDYWKSRGVQNPKDYGLGYYSPLNRYTIPYRGGEGNILNIVFRSASGEEPKYLRLPGVPSVPYVLGRPDADVVVVVEGEIDAVNLHQYFSGWRVIGVPGAATVNDAVVGLVHRAAAVVGIFDRDAAGRRGFERLRVRIPHLLGVEPGDGEDNDLSDFLARVGPDTFVPWIRDAVAKVIEEGPVEHPKGPIPSTVYVNLPDEAEGRRWLIEGVWVDEALGFVAGEPKSLKSMLTLHMGYAVASGKRFVGREVHRPGPVLLIQEEDSDHLIRGRIMNLDGSTGHPNLYLLTPGVWGRHLQLDSEDSIQDLERIIDQLKPVLVIADPLANLHRSEENDATAMNEVLERLRYIRDQQHCSFMLVHHVSKPGMGVSRFGNRLRGSSVLWAKSENLLMVERTGDLLSIQVETKIAPDSVFDIKFNGREFVNA